MHSNQKKNYYSEIQTGRVYMQVDLLDNIPKIQIILVVTTGQKVQALTHLEKVLVRECVI